MPGQLIQAGIHHLLCAERYVDGLGPGSHFRPRSAFGPSGRRSGRNELLISPDLSRRVAYVGAMVDPDTRTTPVRILTRNPGELLKKDMYLEAVIHTRTDKNILTVPVSAVLHDSENEPFVYVEVRPARIRAASRGCGRAAERRRGDTKRTERRRKSGFGRQRVSAVRQQLSIGPSGMISRLVSFALSQRFLIVIASLALMVWGAIAFQRLPIDAYPDLSPPHVEIITQWPGHASEEVERLITIPLEIEMNGIPRLESLRSISLYGLSSVQMNFRVWRRSLLRAGAGLRTGCQCQHASRRYAEPVSPVQSERVDLSLCSAEPGSNPAGTEDYRGLGARPRIPVNTRGGGRLWLWRHDHAVPGAARSEQAAYLRYFRRAGAATTWREQRERGRRLLLTGRPDLLYSRTRIG